MSYNIKVKPTHYNGINFRSKLEAQWACFFDLIGWNWEYEPYDINGKVPDFVLTCSSSAYKTQSCIVEVKPNVFITKEYINHVQECYNNVKAHVLILDENCISQTTDGLCRIGIGSQYLGYHDEGERTDIYNLEWKCCDDFGSNYMIFDGMIEGSVERKNFLSYSYFYDVPEINVINNAWKVAKNTVQFKTYKNKACL